MVSQEWSAILVVEEKKGCSHVEVSVEKVLVVVVVVWTIRVVVVVNMNNNIHSLSCCGCSSSFISRRSSSISISSIIISE